MNEETDSPAPVPSVLAQVPEPLKRVPRDVTIISWLLALKGAWLLLLLLMWIYGLALGTATKPIWTLLWFCSALWGLAEIGVRFTCAVTLSQGKNWARLLYLFWVPASVVVDAYRHGISVWTWVGIAIYLAFLYALTRPGVVAFFHGLPVEEWQPARSCLVLRWLPLAYTCLVVAAMMVCINRTSLRRAERILRSGGLAGLPVDTQDLKSAEWSGPFTGESHVTFRAAPTTINEFLKNSPSLSNAVPVLLNTNHMLLPQTEEFKAGGERFHIGPRTPSWYRPEVRVRGRQYPIPGSTARDLGTVVVDDERNIVWIILIWG